MKILLFLKSLLKRVFGIKNLTNTQRTSVFSRIREEFSPPLREVKQVKIEPRRINDLLDMGVKPVLRLTTASGRTIRTTGNHPYLTREGWRKVTKLSVGQEIAVPTEKYLSSVLSYDVRDSDRYTSVQELSPRPQKPPTTLTSSISFLLPRFNKYTANQAYYTIDKQGNPQDYRKFLKEITSQSNSKNCLPQIRYKFSNKLSPYLIYDIHHCLIYHSVRGLSRLFSGQFAYANADPLAPALVDDGQNLSSIIHYPQSNPEMFLRQKARPFGKERLFLGLIQHRAINFNVGIGTTAPNGKLEVNGSTYIMSGNVGIGTTSPSYTLMVSGTAWCTSGAWSGSDVRWKENV